MRWLDRFFGKKPSTPPAACQGSQRATDELRDDPNLIRVFDGYGRELFITKEQWRVNVLPGAIQSNWDRPDQLYDILVGALNDGFRLDIIEAAEHLWRIDTHPVRAACLWGIVLMQEKRLDEAEKVLRDCLAQHGEAGIVLANLAKVYAARGDGRSEEILWHALEVDPNQDNGFWWYVAIFRERGGEKAALEATGRVAALPGSWRAQLWLARAALEANDVQKALALYREALSRVAKPAPTDLLMQMSGDLGKATCLNEVVELVEPSFEPAGHGLAVGNNLIRAHLDLGRVDAAHRILDQLHALNRPDWKEHLAFWGTEIARARVSAHGPAAVPLQMVLLSVEGPVWLKPDSAASELFPGRRTDGTRISFLGCTAEMADPRPLQPELANAPGQMSRVLPLFLAEQVELASNAQTRTVVPWVTGTTAGFAVMAAAWTDEKAAELARTKENPSDHVVTIHLNSASDPWTVEVRIVRASDATCLGTLEASFPVARPEQAVPDLAQRVLAVLTAKAGVTAHTPSPAYKIPEAQYFASYLVRLEQLLAVRCAGMQGVQAGFLYGAREILDGNLRLCVDCAQNIATRILLAETVAAMQRVRPNVVAEFGKRLALLQKERPLPGPAAGVVQRLFAAVRTD